MSEVDNTHLNDLQLLAVPQLMGKHFFIPDYQRGYRWERNQVYRLLEDLWNYFKNGTGNSNDFYCLQPIVVKACSQETIESYGLELLSPAAGKDNEPGPREDIWYEVIDGQQRLTTIRILLVYCKYWAFNNCIPFTISYATRPELKDIFDNIRINPFERSFSLDPAFGYKNVDVEYIKSCAQLILDWFIDDNQAEANKINGIQTFLSNFYNDSSKDKSVQVIWYETKEATDARDIFERLNNLKVPLSSSELIRAIFLSENASYQCQLTEQQQELPAAQQDLICAEDRRRKQSHINAKWDEIEHYFHNERFWAFITNRDSSSYRNRIELLFDFMSKKYSVSANSIEASDRLYTYICFEKQTRDLWSLWMDVVKYYDTLRSWFENKDYYHKIGFLIHEKNDGILVDLLEYANSDKHKRSEFDRKLDDEIRSAVRTNKKFSELSYDDKGDYSVLKTLLFLYNVEYTRQHSFDEINVIHGGTDSMSGQMQWFPFYLYKSVEKTSTWTLEHIHAQNSECLDASKREEWRDWIAYTIAAREKIICPTDEVKDFIATLKKEKEILDEGNAHENYEKITGLFRRDLDLWSDGKPYTVMHQLSNLALLSGDINSGLGKGAFSLKQQYVNKCLADGRYIPVCTERVFLKHYYPKTDERQTESFESDLLNRQGMTWDDQDRKCYLNDIETVLGAYFQPDKF